MRQEQEELLRSCSSGFFADGGDAQRDTFGLGGVPEGESLGGGLMSLGQQALVDNLLSMPHWELLLQM